MFYYVLSLCCIVFAVCAVAVCASCTAANVCLAAFDLRRAVPRPQRQPADGQSASCMAWRGRSGGKEANADLLLAIINHELRIPSVYNYRCRSQFQHVFPLPLPTPLADKGKQNEAEQRKNKKEKYSNSFSLVLGSDCFSGQGQDAATAAAKVFFHLANWKLFSI